jgi:hypothetical protein
MHGWYKFHRCVARLALTNRTRTVYSRALSQLNDDSVPRADHVLNNVVAQCSVNNLCSHDPHRLGMQAAWDRLHSEQASIAANFPSVFPQTDVSVGFEKWIRDLTRYLEPLDFNDARKLICVWLDQRHTVDPSNFFDGIEAILVQNCETGNLTGMRSLNTADPSLQQTILALALLSLRHLPTDSLSRPIEWLKIESRMPAPPIIS